MRKLKYFVLMLIFVSCEISFTPSDLVNRYKTNDIKCYREKLFWKEITIQINISSLLLSPVCRVRRIDPKWKDVQYKRIVCKTWDAHRPLFMITAAALIRYYSTISNIYLFIYLTSIHMQRDLRYICVAISTMLTKYTSNHVHIICHCITDYIYKYKGWCLRSVNWILCKIIQQ